MSGYENLASYYGALFPPSEALKGFLTPFAVRCRESGAPWLDVGCGTAALLEWLLSQRVDARGVEPDEDFAREAARRLAHGEERIQVGTLQDLGGEVGSAAYGVITCLGNVLAHVSRLEEAADFVRSASSLLAHGGSLIVQTVNFDNVLASGKWVFPVVRRVGPGGVPLVFERFYRLDEYPRTGKLRFETVLRADDRVIENSTLLLPLRRSDLEAIARERFQGVSVCGDFSGAPWDRRSPATILLCR